MYASLPALALLFNAMIWGLAWWPLRQLQVAGLHPLWAVAAVYATALCGFLLVRPQAARVLLRYPVLVWLALASGLTNVGFNWAVTEGDVVRVVLLFYLMPLWSALLAWPLLGERPGRSSLARMAVAVAGVVLVLKTPGSDWPLPSGLVDWLALAAGATFALTNILLRRLRAVPGEARVLAMFGGGLLLAGSIALVGMGQGMVTPIPALHTSWTLLAAALALAFTCGNLALQYGAARLSAHTTAIIMLSEVVFASASAVLLGAASLAPGTWIGGALIVLTALWSALAPTPSTGTGTTTH